MKKTIAILMTLVCVCGLCIPASASFDGVIIYHEINGVTVYDDGVAALADPRFNILIL